MPVANRRAVAPTIVLTPVEKHGGLLVKRDDLASERGVLGGKARTLGVICRHIVGAGYRGLTIHAARNSVTPATLGAVCYAYGVSACVHTAAAKGEMPEPYLNAIRNGARVIEHRPGYMSVLSARAREQAEADNYFTVGLGLDYPPATLETAKQCANLPNGINRLVTAVGSGHMLEGIVRGLEDLGHYVPILGVCVGRIPDAVVKMETPLSIDLLESPTDFNRPSRVTKLGDLELNPYYEAKCIEYLEPGDLLWVVAK